jgi:nitrate/nitrite transporter NarK
MSGHFRAIVIFGAAALILGVALAYIGFGWCMLPLVLVLGLAAGYVGANWQKDDSSKTARNTRNGARSGLIVGIAGMLGRGLVGLIAPAAELTVLDYCLMIVVIAGALALGGVGGWSWARHEHEVQTGYKPT